MSVQAPNRGPTTQPQPAIDHYNDVSTFHDDDFCDAPWPMLCVGCLELTIPKTVLNSDSVAVFTARCYAKRY